MTLAMPLAGKRDAERSGLAATVITQASDWDALASDWEHLHESSPSASPPLNWLWLRTWWDIYGNDYAQRDGLRLLTVRRGGQLIGALPLYAATQRWFGLRRWRFLSTGEANFESTYADYLDLLHAPGAGATCLAAVRELLNENRGGWDETDLGPLAERSPLRGWQETDFPNSRLHTDPVEVSPLADLGGGFEAYLGRLSANSRQQARRLLRAADKAGAVFELATEGEQAEGFFEQLMQLHQERWQAEGAPGSFAARRFVAFHRTLVRAWTARGKAVLARLSVAGQPAALLYGFVARGKFDFYQSGVCVHEGAGLRSPGIVAHLALMRELCVRGVQVYDFLGGAASYKDRLATDQEQLVRLRIRRRTPQAALGGAAELTQRAARKGSRILLRRS